jgi:hypothetical protein
MRRSTFNPCLLYTDKKGLNCELGLQTDDTLFLANEEFATLEAQKLDEAVILANTRNVLSATNDLHFNGGANDWKGAESLSPRNGKPTSWLSSTLQTPSSPGNVQ